MMKNIRKFENVLVIEPDPYFLNGSRNSSFSSEISYEDMDSSDNMMRDEVNQHEFMPGLKWWEILLSPLRVFISIVFNPLLMLIDFIKIKEFRSLTRYQLLGSVVGAVIGIGIFLVLFYLTPIFTGIGGGIAALIGIGYSIVLATFILFKVIASNIWKYTLPEGGPFKRTNEISSGLLFCLHGLNLKNKVAFSILWNFFFSPFATLLTFLKNRDSTNSYAVIGAWIGATIGALLFIQFFLFLPIAPVGIALHLGIASTAGTTAVLAVIGYAMILIPSILFKGVGIALAESGASRTFIVNATFFGRNIATTISLQSPSEIKEEQCYAVADRTSSTARILDAQGGPLACTHYGFEDDEEDLDDEQLERIDCSLEDDEAAEKAQRELEEDDYAADFRRNSF